ncbi:TPA: hypothetical protein EYG96_02440 [Candidatus Gracilibacteria bacterium]|nr:hypothetical protein [Candidatus Gracilibacteria bacterium]HIQ57640.1 hypothetical protein [Candidatus Gracilibacteria bacterium]
MNLKKILAGFILGFGVSFGGSVMAQPTNYSLIKEIVNPDTFEIFKAFNCEYFANYENIINKISFYCFTDNFNN